MGARGFCTHKVLRNELRSGASNYDTATTHDNELLEEGRVFNIFSLRGSQEIACALRNEPKEVAKVVRGSGIIRMTLARLPLEGFRISGSEVHCVA